MQGTLTELRLSAALVAPWMLLLGVSLTALVLLVAAVLAGVGFGYFGTAGETNLQANVSTCWDRSSLRRSVKSPWA